jgi:hypothetical protein
MEVVGQFNLGMYAFNFNPSFTCTISLCIPPPSGEPAASSYMKASFVCVCVSSTPFNQKGFMICKQRDSDLFILDQHACDEVQKKNRFFIMSLWNLLARFGSIFGIAANQRFFFFFLVRVAVYDSQKHNYERYCRETKMHEQPLIRPVPLQGSAGTFFLSFFPICLVLLHKVKVKSKSAVRCSLSVAAAEEITIMNHLDTFKLNGFHFIGPFSTISDL